VKTEVIKTGTLEGLTVPVAPLKAPTVVFEQQGVKVSNEHVLHLTCLGQFVLHAGIYIAESNALHVCEW
jgi:hypothetical protein